jgi:hypothetical protein
LDGLPLPLLVSLPELVEFVPVLLIFADKFLVQDPAFGIVVLNYLIEFSFGQGILDAGGIAQGGLQGNRLVSRCLYL